jgi:hypothetical protein
MSIRIDNGTRVAVKAANFEGTAGLVKGKDGSDEIAYRPTQRGDVSAGTTVTVDGVERTVKSARDSLYGGRFKVLALEPATGSEGGE